MATKALTDADFQDAPLSDADFAEPVQAASPVNVLDKIGRSVQSGVSGLAQGLSLGTSDELTAGLSVPGGMLENLIAGRQVPSIPEQYKLNIDAQRAREAALKAENPLEYMGAEAVGSVAPALVSGGAGLLASGAKTAIPAIGKGVQSLISPASQAVRAAAPMIKQSIAPAKKAGIDLVAEVMKRVGGGVAQGATAGAGYSNADDAAGMIDAAMLPAAIGGALPGLGALKKATGSALGTVGKNMASVFSGVKQEAIDRMAQRPDQVLAAGKGVEWNDLGEQISTKLNEIRKQTSNAVALKDLQGKSVPAEQIKKIVKDEFEKLKGTSNIFAKDPENAPVFNEFKNKMQLIDSVKDKKGNISLADVRGLYDSITKDAVYGTPTYGLDRKINEAFTGTQNKLQALLKDSSDVYRSEMDRISSMMNDLGLGKKSMTPDQLKDAMRRIAQGKDKINDKTITALQDYGAGDIFQTAMDKAAADEFEKTGLRTGFMPLTGMAVGGGLGAVKAVSEGKELPEVIGSGLGGAAIGGTVLAGRSQLGGVAAKTAADLTRQVTKRVEASPIISTAAQRAALQQISKTGKEEKKPMSEIPE